MLLPLLMPLLLDVGADWAVAWCPLVDAATLSPCPAAARTPTLPDWGPDSACGRAGGVGNSTTTNPPLSPYYSQIFAVPAYLAASVVLWRRATGPQAAGRRRQQHPSLAAPRAAARPAPRPPSL